MYDIDMVLLEPKGTCSKHHHIQRRKKDDHLSAQRIVAIVTLKGLTSLKKKGGQATAPQQNLYPPEV